MISGMGRRNQSVTICEIRVNRPTAPSSKHIAVRGSLIVPVYCGDSNVAVGEHENVVRNTETGIKHARMAR